MGARAFCRDEVRARTFTPCVHACVHRSLQFFLVFLYYRMNLTILTIL